MTTSRLVYTSTAALTAAREARAARRVAELDAKVEAYAARLISEDGDAAEYGVKIDDTYGRRRYVTDAGGVAWAVLSPATEGIEWWLIER